VGAVSEDLAVVVLVLESVLAAAVIGVLAILAHVLIGWMVRW
jgi:hypothetical protein